jgi:predicted HAD superfamily Cof-like phosphohydrolase
MEENTVCKKVLKEIAVRSIMKKEELVEFLKNDTENPQDLFRAVAQSLSMQGFIQYVNEIGAFVITRKGLKVVE